MSISIKINNDDADVLLKITSDGNVYSFYYSVTPNSWTALRERVDATYLSTRTAGGFVGCLYAMYASSHGKPSNATVDYDWFEYSGNDSTFNNTK